MSASIVLMAIASLWGSSQTDDRVIRAARDRFNAAIAAHDTVALDRDWADDIEVISSRGAVARGRAAYRELLIDQMRRFADVRYRRQPDTIVISSGWATASESGRWSGGWTAADGPVRVNGRYVAQWRKTDRGWRLTAEAFVAERCQGGDYCRGR